VFFKLLNGKLAWAQFQKSGDGSGKFCA